jgi:signal transduction histidine kinase
MWRSWQVWWTHARGILALVGIGWGVVSTAPRPLWRGAGLVVMLCLAGTVVGWLVWTFAAGRRGPVTAGVILGGACATISSFAQPHSGAIAFGAISCIAAGAGLPLPWSAGLTAVMSATYLTGHLLLGTNEGWTLAGPASFLGGLLIGLVRRQNEKLAAETQLAREEHARAAALAERARIAREIHDVLAHSLGALTVQLETADALLEGGRSAQARESVIRAGQLAREGLAETRRAIGALRGDTLPLPELLAGLASGYRTDLDADASVAVEGEPRELSADSSLALYRTAQEAVTNVRKHAPGSPVRIALCYHPAEVVLRVRSGAPPDGVARPLAAVGGGYGLTGLRERAELAGGEFSAGPDGDGWRVDVRIPT